jgi:hypothetical protein
MSLEFRLAAGTDDAFQACMQAQRRHHEPEPERAELKPFFSAYADAMSAGDFDRIAACYAPRFMMEAKEGSRTLKNNWLFRVVLRMAHRFYSKHGITSLKLADMSTQPLGGDYWLAQVEWRAMRANGEEAVRYDVSYVVRTDREAVIVFFVSHNERERMKARGLL